MDVYRLKIKLMKILNKMVIRNAFVLPNKIKYTMFNIILKEYKYNENDKYERDIVSSICSKRVINNVHGVKIFCWSVTFIILSIISNIALFRGAYALTLLEYIGILVSLVNITMSVKIMALNKREIRELESRYNYIK